MPFPTTGILDDFNRANEGPPLSANWTADPMNEGVSGHQVVSNGCSSGQHSYWDATSFAADQEAWFTVSSLAGSVVALFMRIQSPNTAGSDGYEIDWNTAGGLDIYGLIDSYGGSSYTVATTTIAALATGHKLGARITGSGATVTIDVYIDTGSGWTLAYSVGDSNALRITAGGYIGILTGNTSCVLDDFGGGAYVPQFPMYAYAQQ